MIQKDVLLNNLLKSVPPAIRKRGEELYKRGLVDFIEEDEDTYVFQVVGNQEEFYETDIFFDDVEQEIGLNCDCAYFDGGNVCKHLVASALYLINNFKSQSKVRVLYPNLSAKTQSQKDKPTKAPALKQPISVKLTKDELANPEKKLMPLRKDFEARALIASEIKFLPDKLEAKLVGNPYWYPHSSPVLSTITHKDGLYSFSCEERSHKGFCEHIHWLASFVSLNKENNLLDFVRAEKQQEILKGMLDEYGLEQSGKERVEDLMDIFFIEGGIKIFTKGEIKGLSSPAKVKTYLEKHVLMNTATFEDKQLLFLPQPDEEKSERLPAFIFMINSEEGNLSEINALSGKPTKNKDRLASHLDFIVSPFEADLIATKDFAQAFFLKEKVNLVLDEEGSTAALFQDLQQFFELLGHCPVYVGYETSDYGRRDLPKKSEITLLSHTYHHIRLKFKFFREEKFYTLKSFLELPDGAGVLDIEKEKINVYDDLLLFWGADKLGLINSVKEGLAMKPFLSNPVLRVTEKQLKGYLEEVVKPLAQEFPVEFDHESIDVETVQMQLVQKRLYISELNQYVIFRPVALYQDNREVNVLEDATLFETAEHITQYERDLDAEKSFVELLCSLHPNFKPATQQSFYYLSFEQMQKGFWFLKAFEALKKQDVHVFGFNKLKNFKFSPHQPKVSVNFSSGQDWFETNVEVAFGNNKVKLKDLRKAVQEGSGYIELSDGTIGILPEEWLKKFEKIFRSAQLDKDSARIPKTHFNLLDDLVDEQLNPEVFKEIEEKKRRLARFRGIQETTPPAMLKAKLRKYQQDGLNWLNFLREYGWGGILADDMGLGKTLQALALIGLEIEKNPKQPNLVIAPTTLLFNWKKEIEKFAPDIDFIIHHGQRYNSAKELSNYQLVLTSYGIIINDIDILKKIKFNLIIADESQAIKNVHSRRHKSITQLQGRVRLGMSGTPIENNIFELYAQMNFANPAFFQSISAFKSDYARPIEQERDEMIIQELKKKIGPFILRRTKAQVLTELPDKTEEYLYCEMGPAQRKVYDAYRNEYRDYLLKKFEEEGVEKSQMYVLEGLTKLRQVCDSPLLVESDFPADKVSAKMEELLTHVMEKTGNHKILVFSQFVGMLQLIEQQFQKLDIPYEYLDGKTSLKEREIRVQRFQEDPDRRVFLISLKAGGTGLNLTAADYVYLIDPWWNPAVENQAIDRCYRMGQEKKVFAYRMICKDTVEEKIIQLQEQKKQLSDELVGGNDNVMKKLSKDDIVALFS